ncbi:hypothetical protein [Deefgea sp. CFH1-16]|uniref:hypothetical protein n=1 Tax=Deefgea sp. CFH1-16 TaxID=2675457 RepID=UPI001940346F|nr:hypothetical protein [Deefgea sp. CFH1-16]
MLVMFLMALLSGAAQADRDWGDDSHKRHQPKWQQRDSAVIRSVQPRYESIGQPRQECRSEWVMEIVAQPTSPNYGGAIIGGAAGGLWVRKSVKVVAAMWRLWRGL